VVDAQAGMEAAELTLLSMQAGSNLNHDVGYLDFGLTGALELVVIVDEFIAMNRRLLAGIEVDRETLAVDVIARSARAATSSAPSTPPSTCARRSGGRRSSTARATSAGGGRRPRPARAGAPQGRARLRRRPSRSSTAPARPAMSLGCANTYFGNGSAVTSVYDLETGEHRPTTARRRRPGRPPVRRPTHASTSSWPTRIPARATLTAPFSRASAMVKPTPPSRSWWWPRTPPTSR
jgi:hypothetical protein